MKCTTNGDKPTDMNSHLEFSAMWVHKLATTGVRLGKRGIFVGDPNRSGARELVHFENVTLHGYLLNYNGDCIDLTQVMNCMGAANANCCLPFSNLSAVRIGPRHLSFSASLLLKREEFQVKSSAESEAHVKIVEDSKGTPTIWGEREECFLHGLYNQVGASTRESQRNTSLDVSSGM